MTGRLGVGAGGKRAALTVIGTYMLPQYALMHVLLWASRAFVLRGAMD